MAVMGLFFNINAQNNQPNIETEGQGKAEVPGFNGILWGTKYEDVKGRFQILSDSSNTEDAIQITKDDPEKEIIVERKGIMYRYLFYKKPKQEDTRRFAKLAAESRQNFEQRNRQAQPAEGEQQAKKESETARFFFMESRFTLVNAGDLHNKLKNKYGSRTRSTLDNDLRGAFLWDLQDGFLIQWLEPYKDKVFSRSMYYISKQIRDEIKKDLNEYMYSRELQAIENILP